MGITDTKVKEYETKVKEIYYNVILDVKEKESRVIMDLQNSARKLNINENIPNMWTSINNKYIELSRQFERSGISIYSKKLEEYGPHNLELVLTNTLGIAIFDDLVQIKLEANEKIQESKKENKEEKNSIKNFIGKIRNKLGNNGIEHSQEELKTIIEEFKKSDDSITSYKLDEETVIRAVKNYLIKQEYSKDTMLSLTDDICDDLNKLGIDNVKEPLKNEIKNINTLENNFLQSLKVDVDSISPNSNTKINTEIIDYER